MCVLKWRARDPVIVMVRSESFWDVVAEVRRDAVDFPLEGVKRLIGEGKQVEK